MAGEATVEANMGRSTFRGPMEGRPEWATARGKTKRLDIRGDVEDRQRESLRAPVPREGAGAETLTRESGKGRFGGRPKTEGRRNGGRGIGAGGG